MITEEQLEEIRQLLKKSERPLFLYDDDTDGLCSYLLLKKYIKRGKGVIVKSSPILSRQFVRKVEEYGPDRIFVLDKPGMEQEFIDDSKVQVVWIDHHSPVHLEGVHYFNPRLQNDKDNRPTSYWCYKVAKQNLWLAMCGVVGDWCLPEFTKDFMKKYPDMLSKAESPGQVLYDSELGKLIRVLEFILKGKTSDIKKCISILEKIDDPYEILNQESSKGKFLYKYHERTNKAYQNLLKEAAEKVGKDDFVVYTYPASRLSLSGDLANELMYRYPDKFIIVGRVKEKDVVVSIRGDKFNLPKMIAEALEDLEGYGGGHEHACGGCISKKDFHVFTERLKNMVKKK